MQNSTSANAEKNLSNVVKIDEAQIQQHLGEMVRSTVEEMLKAIHAQEDLVAAREKARAVVAKLETMKLRTAAEKVREGIEETLTYYAFPDKHHRQIRTNNPLERIMREIRRRSRVVGCVPDGQSALMLAAARLRYIAGSRWGTRRYMNMERLKELKREQQAAAEEAA